MVVSWWSLAAGLEPGVISVIASATCSEAAEAATIKIGTDWHSSRAVLLQCQAAVRAAYEEVLHPSLELEPGRRPS